MIHEIIKFTNQKIKTMRDTLKDQQSSNYRYTDVIELEGLMSNDAVWILKLGKEDLS